jgi:RND family efflux transporter MFP subunit
VSKSSLLNQLQINRDERRADPDRPFPWWILGVAAALMVAAAGVWFLIARPDRAEVRVAEAVAVASSGAAGGSLLDASGYVVPRRAATVSSKITGKVMEVLIEEGQHVEAGQILARLDDSNSRANLVQAQAQAAASEANFNVARLAFEQAGPRDARKQSLFKQGYLSAQSVEDSRASYDTARYTMELARRQAAAARAGLAIAQRNVDDTVVRAPFAGVVTVKAAQPGEMVSPISAGGGFTRTGIGTIVDMDSLEVEVDVAESFINRVREGMPAAVKLNAYPDWEIPASVIAVIPTADRSKATVSVRVGMKVKDPRIVPEMGARVSFLAPATAAAAGPRPRNVRVPADAVLADGQELGVVFILKDGRLERRAVRLGARDAEGQVLQSGVSAGDRVVLGDLDKLEDGQKVRVTTKAPKED